MAKALSEAGIPFRLVLAANDPTIQEYRDLEYSTLTVDAKDIRSKRQAIFEHARYRGKIVMFDDDLRIYRRKRDGNFRLATSSDLRALIDWLDTTLEDHAHAGLVDKFMSQSRPRGTAEYGRYNQVLAYNLSRFPTPKPAFRFFVNSDHDMHLQLAAAGCPPSITYEFSKDAAYYAKGGFDYRTAELERKAKLAFQREWKDYVKLAPTEHSLSKLAIRVKWKQIVEDHR